MAANHAQSQPPSIYDASALWTAMGLFGLFLGTLLLAFGGGVFSAVEWLAEISHSGPNALSPETTDTVREAIGTWGWAGITVAAITLPLGNSTFRSKLAHVLRPIASRGEDDLLPPDRHGLFFFLGLFGVLVFAVLAHWLLRTYIEVGWLESEDGLSEWWSVATYLAGAVAAGAAAWSLRDTGHSLLRYFYLILAVGLLLGAMEEISWGQRLLGWGTPPALEGINFQGETTLHNVNFANNAIFEALFWGSALGLTGGLWRLTANLRGLSDRMRLVLPSLMLAPALLLIMVWRTGDLWESANIPRLFMDLFNSGPRGSEVPEALLGLCIVIYTFSNLKQARYLSRQATRMATATTPSSQTLAKRQERPGGPPRGSHGAARGVRFRRS